jgi:hypothetical protein
MAREYRERLLRAGVNTGAAPGIRMHAESGALRFPILLRDGWTALRRTRAPNLGAAPGYPTTLRALPALAAQLVNRDGEVSGSARLAHQLVTLPTHAALRAADIRDLVEIVMQLPFSEGDAGCCSVATIGVAAE